MKHDDLTRFSYFERIVHWVLGLSFVFLLFTGLALSYPSLFWLTALTGGGLAARVLHPWIGLLFAVSVVLMLFLWARDMLVGKADREWLAAVKHYARHERDKVPPTGKYNGGQKVFFWLQFVLGIVLLATGLPLWLPGSFGAGTLATMRLLHYFCALGGGLLLIVHVYLGTVAYPGTARSMLYGTVSRAWARLHHPLWYEQKTKS
jgi:formate dehydrogenase subunit gamma